LQAVLIHGVLHEVMFGNCKKAQIQDNRVLLPLRVRGDYTKAANAIIRLLNELCNDYVTNRISQTMGRFYPFRLSNARTKWGSCKYNGEISLNWRIICLPARLSDYIIVHELCHLRHHNHGKGFWNEVAGVLPDYKERRKELKEYSVLVELYRNPTR